MSWPFPASGRGRPRSRSKDGVPLAELAHSLRGTVDRPLLATGAVEGEVSSVWDALGRLLLEVAEGRP